MRLIAAAYLAMVVLTIAAQNKTTQDGIYSEAQAKRGDALYAKSCASCHGASLEGDGQAPALADAEFASEWNNQTLSDLFERIRTTMPGDAPGTLKPEEVADLMAYMFSRAKYPAGPSELPHDVAALKAITYMAAPR
jgi:mono/diheme cytochrome c family protein